MHANSWFGSSRPIWTHSNLKTSEEETGSVAMVLNTHLTVCWTVLPRKTYLWPNWLINNVWIAHNCAETSGTAVTGALTCGSMICCYVCSHLIYLLCCVSHYFIDMNWILVLKQFVTNTTAAPSSGITKASHVTVGQRCFFSCIVLVFLKGPFFFILHS